MDYFSSDDTLRVLDEILVVLQHVALVYELSGPLKVDRFHKQANAPDGKGLGFRGLRIIVLMQEAD